MSGDMRDRRLAFHFTHMDNLDAALAAGELRCDGLVHGTGILAKETGRHRAEGQTAIGSSRVRPMWGAL